MSGDKAKAAPAGAHGAPAAHGTAGGGHAPDAGHTAPAGHAPAASAQPITGPAIDGAEAKRVGGFAGISGWVFGLIAGAIVAGLATVQSTVLFGLVGVPVVLVSYFLASFMGGRIARDFFQGRPKA